VLALMLQNFRSCKVYCSPSRLHLRIELERVTSDYSGDLSGLNLVVVGDGLGVGVDQNYSLRADTWRHSQNCKVKPLTPYVLYDPKPIKVCDLSI
jgi:hypothetical protein